MRDVGRFVLIFFRAAIYSAFFGMLTLLGDGLVGPENALKTIVKRWASDAIAIVACPNGCSNAKDRRHGGDHDYSE